MTVKELVAQMLLWMSVNSPYSMPETPPEVMILPQEEIEAAICNGPCPALGAYIPEQGVLLSDTLDIRDNVCHRSILLHELVHFLQHHEKGDEYFGDNENEEPEGEDTARAYITDPDKWSWAEREYEAYDYQNRYLGQNAAIAPGPVPRDVRHCRYLQRQEMRREFLAERDRKLRGQAEQDQQNKAP